MLRYARPPDPSIPDDDEPFGQQFPDDPPPVEGGAS
jgi:hypothetical protein